MSVWIIDKRQDILNLKDYLSVMHEQNLISRLAAGPKEIANISRGQNNQKKQKKEAKITKHGIRN